MFEAFEHQSAGDRALNQMEFTPDGSARFITSSTSVNLPEYQAEAVDACLRVDAKPEAMEHLPAEDKTAVNVSLAMVDRADVYVGTFGWRYGHVPDG